MGDAAGPMDRRGALSAADRRLIEASPRLEHANCPQLFDSTWVGYNVEAMARSDVQLMLDVKATGDEVSFELLLRKYRCPLVNFLARMVRDRGMAEELAQEVFLRVYRARKAYAPSAKFTTWMFRIASNLALNAIRDGRCRQLEISMDQPTELGDEEVPGWEVADRHPSVEQKLIARDRAEIIQRAIAQLPDKQRAAVLLHKYQELDYDEIARILECSEAALKSLLFRAYETLRVQLAPLVGQPKI
jgi:RNA polymerase sigma-70 factor, ECF subfamily